MKNCVVKGPFMLPAYIVVCYLRNLRAIGVIPIVKCLVYNLLAARKKYPQRQETLPFTVVEIQPNLPMPTTLMIPPHPTVSPSWD